MVKFTADYSINDRYEWFWDMAKDTGTTTNFGDLFGLGEVKVPHKWAVALRDATPPRAHEYDFTIEWRDKGRLVVESDWSGWRRLKWWQLPY